MTTFTPRPEAQATKWDDLMPPVKMAVRDLLVRIHGAHCCVHSKNADKPIMPMGNCFLVYGARGTGKTTVLLNAKKAVCRENSVDFFVGAEPLAKANETDDEKKAREAVIKLKADAKEEAVIKLKADAKEEAVIKLKADAKENAEYLRKDGVVWLDILNLEPIPSEANLLTVLLTQVRNALHTHCDKRQREQRSIFEEEANSAQQQLNKLINDTTLMWQNISEPDTRTISARQVKAADIYAEFPEKFKKAMDKLIEELSDTRSSDSKVSIVLPIDNIDRSTEHLQSIVKLAQLVSHPNLWLVMAGDRVEVETFLERAYWKELIRSSDGAGAREKIDSDGEDEALVMARRQANATAQKLWPSNHRVEIDFLKAEDTLEFKPHYPNNGKTKYSIGKLLKGITIPMTDKQREYKSDCDMNILKLFNVTEEVGKKENGKEQLTRAAQYGLSLPARSVLDLWQLLDWLSVDESSKNFKAEKVARTMLRNIIASSAMPNKTTQYFQNHILGRSKDGGTMLCFSEKQPFEVGFLTLDNNDFKDSLSPVIFTPTLRSQLSLNDIKDVILYLDEKLDNALPPLVAAWLMVIHDILILAEEKASWVIGSPTPKWFNVSVTHTVLVGHDKKYKKRDVELYWKAPDWGLFWGRNIFRLLWRNFRKKILKTSLERVLERDSVTRLLAAGWIYCVLKTAFELIESIDSQFASLKHELQKFNTAISDFEKNGSIQDEKKMQEFKDAVQKFTVLSDFEKNASTQNEQKIQAFKDAVQKINAVLSEFDAKNSLSKEQGVDKLVLRFKFILLKHDTLELTGKVGLDVVADNVDKFETDVIDMAVIFYNLIQDTMKLQSSTDENPAIIPAAYEVMLATGEWLETELIYFLTYAYVPIKSSKERLERMWNNLLVQNNSTEKKSVLQAHWQDNLPFIWDELETRLVDSENEISDKQPKSVKDSDTKTKTKTTESFIELLFDTCSNDGKNKEPPL